MLRCLSPGVLRASRLLMLAIALLASASALANEPCNSDEECSSESFCRDHVCRDKQKSVPPFYQRKGPEQSSGFPFVFMQWKNTLSGEHGAVVGPVLYAADRHRSSFGIFPLFGRFHDERKHSTTHLFLPPLVGFHSDPQKTAGHVGPVWAFRGSEGSGGGIFPIFGYRHDAVNHEMRAMLGPLFFKHQPNGFDAGLFPLVFFGRHTDSGYAALLPLFFHRSDAGGTTDLIGPFYLRRGKHDFGVGLPPFYFSKGENANTQVVFPLLFRHREGDHEAMLLGPFYYERQGEERVRSLPPLFYARTSPTHDLVFAPGAVWRKNSTRDTLIIGPYAQDRKGAEHTRMFFPFLAVHHAPHYDVYMATPLVWRVYDKDDVDTVIFPFYWRARSPERSIDGVFPLVLHAHTKVADTTIAGPLWWRKRVDGGRQLGIFPLFAYGKSIKDGKTSKYFGMPGLFWAKNEKTGTRNFVFGPFFDFGKPTGYTAGLFPISYAWRRGTVSHVLLPFVYHLSDSATGEKLTVVGPAYYGNNQGDKKAGLFPLYFGRYRADGTSATTVLPLFYYGKRKQGGLFLSLLGGYAKNNGGTRAYFGPFYGRKDRYVRSGALWPIAYFMRDHYTGARVDMFLPFLFDGRNHDGKELQMYTPLAWRYHTIESSAILGLPLFLDVNRYHQSRLTTLLPFFLRSSSAEHKTLTWIFPAILAWSKEHIADHTRDWGWFPLVWRFGGDKPTTIVAPFFWDFKRGEQRTTIFAPIGATWKRPDGQSTLILNVYYRKGHGPREGSYSVHVIPLCNWGRPRPQDLEWDVLLGLFGYHHTGQKRFVRLFWGLDIPLKQTQAQVTDWFGSTPPSARTTF